MSSKQKDEIINKFITIAECSRELATECLQGAQWNEEAALTFFLESSHLQASNSSPSTEPRRFATQTTQNIPENTAAFKKRNDSDAEESLLQSALEESLRFHGPEKSNDTISKRINSNKSIISSKSNTFNNHDDDSQEEGEISFYVDDSECSVQKTIEPAKNKDNGKKASNIFEAAQDDNIPVRAQDHSSSVAPVAASNHVETLPIRFYSNGFTVGDGELRKFENNEEFINSIKRGEVPNELKKSNTSGRQIEVSLEDRRSEECKRVTLVFKPFAGTGHVVGLSGSAQVPFQASSASHTNKTVGTPDADILEKLAEKSLKTSSSSTTIRLRLPDISIPVRIQLDLNRTLTDVRKFLNENVPSLQTNAFEFMEPPSTKIKREVEKGKICDTNISNSTLVVRRTAYT
ncbi:unnamed protein product [Rotaria magnacalcarata]|uniref:SEP domain-containing protein n=5 Tax=Rotaria magnacalcarata TaxID=392030 RepID=A0A815E5U5_9BILA|nr:unnamed protein product [Rotaria magnacalcarata]CAF1587800.1 unnamed protein product [Rotaria magnacalcarata]CAF3765393.1 unnamed protein product [Rotaria magnacalcarata]